MKTVYITEEQKHKLGLLLEDKEGKNLGKARRYLELNGYTDPNKRQQILDSIRTDIPNARLQQCKFILGIVRMYVNGELNDGQSIAKLNKTLKYIASDAHVNEYDNNLNNESIETLVNRFSGVAKDDLEQSMAASNARQFTVNESYRIVPIDTPEEAAKYGKYTSWCVTHDEEMYKAYTNGGIGRFYFCLKNGFENEPKEEGKGCPLDSYGLSMIAVSVTMEGEANTITCRWNHDKGGDDNIMTIEQLEDVIGRNFYQTFKPYSREELHSKGVVLFDEVQGLLDNEVEINKIFENWDEWFDDNVIRVYLHDKYNFVKTEYFKDSFDNNRYRRKLLSEKWFDNADIFYDGFAKVKINNKYNFIDKNGNFLLKQWYDYVKHFEYGFAVVGKNRKYNFVDKNGYLITDIWFDRLGSFKYDSVFNEVISYAELDGEFMYFEQERGDGKEDTCNRVRLNKKVIWTESKQVKANIIERKKKKKPAAQDQVGGKVNAGVMDAVVGGMCEDTEDDKFVLGAEMNAPIGGVYYHVKEGKINESPDYVDFFDVKWRTDGSYPFMYLLSTQEFYVGKEQETHMQTIYRYAPEIFKELEDEELDYEKYVDTTLTGRYWKEYNVISFWKTPIDKRMNVRKVVDALKEQGIIQSSEYTVLDYWDNNTMSNCVFPIKWLFNGTYDMFAGRCSRITPIKLLEYFQTGKYSYFQVTTNGSGIQCVNVSGDEVLTGMEYYMKSSSMNEGVEDKNRMVDIRRIVQTDNFKRWFGNSKVVDENGFPIIVHHGSPKFIGDKFDKNKIGKSLNGGEEGLFCTTQDMSWAKRFSYPISPGSYSFTVKVDYSKPGDILSGFLKLEHPLDFFNLSEQDIENMFQMHLKYDEWGKLHVINGDVEEYHEEFVKLIKMLLNVPNHQATKFFIHRNLGNALKEFGYDGLIASMKKTQSDKIDSKEYCFLEPNQFKSIYSLAFSPNNDSIYEDKKKVVKNDKGEVVPDKCDKCGGDVVLQIHGEPVYVCKDCGKYFGTMPFTLKENRDYSKWLEQLKQRRDPDNIEENIENEISPEDVDLSSFNIKRRLNPKFWVDGHLDSRIRLKLMDISDDFIEYLGIDPHIVKDVLMTGSLANFNWSEEFSDIDLHVLLDYSDVDENTEFVKQYFMSQKNSWNNEHGDIKIFGFPVEVYVQDVNEKHDSSGVYSLDKDKWLVEPDRDVLATSKVNKAFIKDKVSDYTNKIDKLIYLYEKAKDDEYKLGKIAEKANVLWDEIKNSRKKGFEISNGKEINNFNIIFKTLRRFDYLDKLYQLKTKTYNKLNSIE